MSQAASTFSLNHPGSLSRAYSFTKRNIRAAPLIDGTVIIVILTASLICASVYWRTSAELSAATAKHQAMQRRLEQLQIDTGRLERDIERLRTDSSFVETVARQNLGFVRPGEMVIRLNRDAKRAMPGEREVRVAKLGELAPNLTRIAAGSYTATSN